MKGLLLYQEKINKGLAEILSSYPFQDVLRYHLGLDGGGGKRIRPILCLIVYRGLGGEADKAMPAALALELVHNFSLVHDDIQDQDRIRHHRPTLWALWGRGMAFNFGWLLWLIALNSLKELRRHGFPEETLIKTKRILQESCLEMIEGQFLDLSFEGREDMGLESYLEMIGKKTGSLFSASLKIAGVLASVDSHTLDKLGECGRKLGLAFQIKDDILGIWGREERTGKPASDLKKRKKTLPVIYLLEKDDKILPSIYRKEEISEGDIRLILKLLDEAGAKEFAQNRLRLYLEEFDREIGALGLSDSSLRELGEVERFLIEREY